jgi:NO-binding membrane sensor protein with MHYT domain
MTLPEPVLAGSYDYRLVTVSVLIAVLASYAALDLGARVTAAHGRARLAWLTGGATAMGIGVWSMHYIGMLAFSLSFRILYDWPTVLLSLLAAVFASGVALFVVSRSRMSWFQALIGSVAMGSGIAGMHYIGMAAMRMPAMCTYSSGLVILSVVLAVVISLVALWLTFHFRDEPQASGGQKIASALVMGAAIPVMHYTGMAAASFTVSAIAPDLTHFPREQVPAQLQSYLDLDDTSDDAARALIAQAKRDVEMTNSYCSDLQNNDGQLVNRLCMQMPALEG